MAGTGGRLRAGSSDNYPAARQGRARGTKMENYRLLWLLFLVVNLLALIVELVERPRPFTNLLTPLTLFAGVVIFGLLSSGLLNRKK
jgi:hypothetical protein